MGQTITSSSFRWKESTLATTAGRAFDPPWPVKGTFTTTTCPCLKVVVEGIVLVFPGSGELLPGHLPPRQLLEVSLLERLDERIGLAVVRHHDRLVLFPRAGQVLGQPVLDFGHAGKAHAAAPR